MFPASQPLLEVQGLCKTYTQGRWWQRQFQVNALENVNLILKVGGTLALVGESGSGKTTLAMCLVGLEEPDSGDIRFQGMSLLDPRRKERAAVHAEMQLIFQASAGALSPRMSAAEIIEEPLRIRGLCERKERGERVLEAMEQVGLPTSWKNRRPHQMSGGQRQRLAIARALALRPKLLLLDEALTGLDLSIQGQITNLLLDLQTRHGLSYLYISHNLELVAHIADEIAVIHQGRIVEQANPYELFSHPRHPRSQALIASVTASRSALAAHGGT